MHHAVVTPGHNGTEPDCAHPAHAETCPVAMGGEMVIEQRRQTHPLHLLDQQRNVVDALRDDVGYLIHAQSLAQSGIYLQIWANREGVLITPGFPKQLTGMIALIAHRGLSLPSERS